MAERHSEFEKLLSEAPMASDVDRVTLVGSLARTSDPGCFVLRMPDGRSAKLEVDAVKSAKTIAGGVGQSLVELEVDATRVPKEVFGLKAGSEASAAAIGTPWYQDVGLTTRTYLTPYSWTADHRIPYKTHADQPDFLAAEPSPFVAAMPHQADPATRALLASPFAGTRTYLTAETWTWDHHVFPKVRLDPA
jgi:hypothetical protein